MTTNLAPQIRVATHPGRPLAERAVYTTVDLRRTVRIVVEEGDDLYRHIHDTLDADGLKGAVFTLVSGAVSRLTIMTGGPGDGRYPMGFKGPHLIDGPLKLVAGAGGIGIDDQIGRFTHCHAVFRNLAGRLVGGHLIPGETIAGPGGIALDLVAMFGARFARRLDPETLFEIFHPEVA